MEKREIRVTALGTSEMNRCLHYMSESWTEKVRCCTKDYLLKPDLEIRAGVIRQFINNN